MPKKTKIASAEQPDDDKILLDGILKIRQGIVDGDWQVVCDAYNSVTGEKLEPKSEVSPPKSRLAKIREAVGNTEKPEPIAENADDNEDLESLKPEIIEREDGVKVITVSKNPEEAARNKKNYASMPQFPPRQKYVNRSIIDTSHLPDDTPSVRLSFKNKKDGNNAQ